MDNLDSIGTAVPLRRRPLQPPKTRAMIILTDCSSALSSPAATVHTRSAAAAAAVWERAAITALPRSQGVSVDAPPRPPSLSKGAMTPF
jgi:hypothetical protein